MRIVLAVLIAAGCVSALAQQAATPLPSAASAAAGRSNFWRDAWRGWHFYEDPEPPLSVEATPPATIIKKPTDPRAPELVEFENLQKRVKEMHQIAIVNPTDANVRRYLEVESVVYRQAKYFSDVAQRVGWASPELDMRLEGRPLNARAIQVFDREQQTSRNESVAALAQTHVLFFFFRSDCPYCHAFAPTLESFQARYGLKVVAISLDGGPLSSSAGFAGFADYRADNGISKTLHVTNVPAVYLAQPFTGRITPIGFGVLSETELIERISTVTASGAEAVAPSVYRQISLQ